MSIAKSVRFEDRRLEIEDEDGGLHNYIMGKVAPDGATIHVAFTAGLSLALVLAPDKKPILRQDEPGLPKKIGVQLLDSSGSPSPFPVVAGWGVTYEFEQG